MKIIDLALSVAKKAGKLTIEQSQKPLKISEKSRRELVTNVDKASEKLILAEIKKYFPSHAIIAEESTDLTALSTNNSGNTSPAQNFAEAKYIWLIDPIDGTTNFAHGLPLYAVSIGVFKMDSVESSKNFEYLSGELVAGVVYAPKLGEMFHAEKGKGAYLNGKKIKVSKVAEIKDSLSVTGFPAHHRERNLPYFQAMLGESQAIRRLGSAAIDLCYVACGRFDTYWEFGLKPWDIAAGALIIEEAGGRVTDSNGEPLDLFGADILATNSLLHKKVINKFKKL